MTSRDDSAVRDLLATDELAELLERRIAAIEEVIAASWLRRPGLIRRLRRLLRVSIHGYEGDFFSRRAEDQTDRFLDRQRALRERKLAPPGAG